MILDIEGKWEWLKIYYGIPLGRHQPSTHLDIPRYSGFYKLTVKQKL